jgi:uncharacterized UBP type Zn finger protein
MTRKCIYCKSEIPNESVIDFCSKCGVSVWGEKMFNTIVKNMEEARDNNDLCRTNMNPEEVENFNNASKR